LFLIICLEDSNNSRKMFCSVDFFPAQVFKIASEYLVLRYYFWNVILRKDY